MQPDHAKRPIWVCDTGRIIFETFHPQGAQVADFLIAVSEPVSRPQTIHEYQITALSLNAAIANGISVEKIIQLLVKLSKNVIHEDFLSFIREKGRTTGKLRLVLRGGRHFLESEDEALLRDVSSEATVAQLQQLEWGLLVVDEVQVMPARTFRTVATTIKSHCCLGLTATLVREDDLIQDLHWLIGPKLYEANWQQLQDDGYLARVRCIEVWCDMSEEFFVEYLQAGDGADVPGSMRAIIQRALWTCNPKKLNTCEYLIRFHEQRGDKIIVFSDNIFILKEFAKKLGRYYICGSVDMRERMQILSEFQESSACNTVFLSKVGDNAIDLPVANVIVQISSHYGSRRQEAQRLGRILRPKPNVSGRFNAYFYSVVSRDTQELYHANRRQQFLVEQGYNYQVVRDQSVARIDQQGLSYSSKESQLQLLKQVLESVRRGETEEADEDCVPQEPASRPTQTAPPEPEHAATAASSRPEEKVSLASLSGGLDGSYVVAPTRKRLKLTNSQ
ncbi:unnamed protein product [Effrenium voratum]|nr:unnamed protein product [Effrenium voratum]